MVGEAGRGTHRQLVLVGLLLLVSVSAAAIGFLIYRLVVTPWPPLVELDTTVLDAAEAHVAERPWLVMSYKAVSRVTVPIVYQVLAIAVAALLMWRRRWVSAVYTAVAILPGLVLAPLLKDQVRRARPSPDDPWAGAGGYSFPSGHALSAVVVALVLLVLVLPLLSTPFCRAVAVAGTAAAVAVVCVSRVGLGVHYVSDVLAGCVIGVAWVALVTASALPLLWRETRTGTRQIA